MNKVAGTLIGLGFFSAIAGAQIPFVHSPNIFQGNPGQPPSASGPLLLMAAFAIAGASALVLAVRRGKNAIRREHRGLVPKPTYGLNLICMLLKDPDHYLARLRAINQSADLATKDGRITGSMMLRDFCKERDLIKGFSYPLQASDDGIELGQVGEKRLRDLRATIEERRLDAYDVVLQRQVHEPLRSQP